MAIFYLCICVVMAHIAWSGYAAYREAKVTVAPSELRKRVEDAVKIRDMRAKMDMEAKAAGEQAAHVPRVVPRSNGPKQQREWDL